MQKKNVIANISLVCQLLKSNKKNFELVVNDNQTFWLENKGLRQNFKGQHSNLG